MPYGIPFTKRDIAGAWHSVAAFRDQRVISMAQPEPDAMGVIAFRANETVPHLVAFDGDLFHTCTGQGLNARSFRFVTSGMTVNGPVYLAVSNVVAGSISILLRSTDGLNWVEVAAGPFGTGGDQNSRITFNKSTQLFYAFGSGPADPVWSSADGLTWFNLLSGSINHKFTLLSAKQFILFGINTALGANSMRYSRDGGGTWFSQNADVFPPNPFGGDVGTRGFSLYVEAWDKFIVGVEQTGALYHIESDGIGISQWNIALNVPSLTAFDSSAPSTTNVRATAGFYLPEQDALIMQFSGGSGGLWRTRDKNLANWERLNYSGGLQSTSATAMVIDAPMNSPQFMRFGDNIFMPCIINNTYRMIQNIV